MQAWLKSLGTANQQIPEVGLTKIDYITRDIGFPVDPSVKTGDRLVLYATGYGKFFGVVEVHLPPYLDNREAPWSYRVEFRARSILDELQRAPDLDELSVKRNLRKSIKQQSHIQLSPAEYEVAVEALERAADLDKGDLREPSLTGRI
jgi:hypothetical protein